EAASDDPLWDSTSLAALFGSKAPEGSTLEAFLSDVPLEPPLQGTLGVNSEYGWRRDPITWKKSFHTGVDLAAQEGQEVFSSGRGIVTETRHSDSYGNCVRIQHEGGVVTFYCHMQYIFVHQGERVDAGTRIGTAGQTGRTTGPHLHFELLLDGLRYDPAQVLGL
ncbi:MAG: M23 family metallopeptidase, partial [Oscillospiraceae bacterium]|nr:M23 family metallopeptidase [Oscillospiraceae bacterium]